MAILQKDTQAIQIHGRTKQQIAECVLDAGTAYTLTDVEPSDPLGHSWVRIGTADNFLYDVLKSELD